MPLWKKESRISANSGNKRAKKAAEFAIKQAGYLLGTAIGEIII